MDITSYLLGKKASGGGGGGSTEKIQPASLSFKNYRGDSINSNIIDASRIIATSEMFGSCTHIKELDLSSWDLSEVLYANNMFNGCSELETLKINESIETKLINMLGMFWNCPKLKKIEGWNNLNTSNVTTFANMFQNCVLLEEVPIIDISKAGSGNLQSMFFNCPALTDNALDNILLTCLTNTTYSSHTLYHLGFRKNQYPASRIEALPHYQDFLDAGWTIGY